MPRALERLAAVHKSGDGAEAFHWAFVLRGGAGGWTDARQYFEWLREADVRFGGGRAVPVFLEGLRRDALATLKEAERATLGPLLEPGVDSGTTVPNTRAFVRAWRVADLGPELDGLAGRLRAEDLLESLLEPSRDVPERYRDTLT